MDSDILDNDDEIKFIEDVFDYSNIKIILNAIKKDFEKGGRTTNIQVDVLVVLFRVTGQDRVFDLLFILHHRLLLSIVNSRYLKYKTNLYEEDFNDMLGMISEEFVRRVRFYKIPSETPFSGYCKDYLKKWLNRYTQLMVDKNVKCILKADMDGNENG